ncbi:hypothetical protein CHH59_06180 [Shouchella clausii]|nr:hypothetical protein CHH59_06180 [Shouchella clausii]
MDLGCSHFSIGGKIGPSPDRPLGAFRHAMGRNEVLPVHMERQKQAQHGAIERAGRKKACLF